MLKGEIKQFSLISFISFYLVLFPPKPLRNTQLMCKINVCVYNKSEMQLDNKTYKQLNDLFEFDANPLEKYKTVAKAEDALNRGLSGWGKSNLLIPKDHIGDWFGLAVEGLKKGKRVVVINTFNPHYKYWFKYVWPWASKVVLYTQNKIVFKGYKNPCPKTVAVILFDPQQRSAPRKKLFDSYTDEKYPYFRLPLKVKKGDV